MSPNDLFDASAVVRFRSSRCSTHDVLTDAFSLTLTTTALDRSSSGLFEASPCRAAPEDLPPSPLELQHFNKLLFVSCLVAHVSSGHQILVDVRFDAVLAGIARLSRKKFRTSARFFDGFPGRDHSDAAALSVSPTMSTVSVVNNAVMRPTNVY
jgi:hypothetical protein